MSRSCLAVFFFLQSALFHGASASAAEESPELLVNGGFEETDGALPRGWSLSLGARNSNSTKASEVRVEEGAAVLRGDSGVGIWNNLSQTVPVTPGQTLRVTGRIKTRNVGPVGRQYTSCNIIMMFETGREGDKPVRLIGTKPRHGTRDWQPLVLRAEVPPGAARVRIGCFLACSGTAWFDDLSLRVVEPARWTKLSGALYNMYSLEGNTPTEADLAANEATCRDTAHKIGAKVPDRIAYYVYPSTAIKEEFTGDPGNAHVAPGKMEIHSIFRRDTHEVVHLLTREWGNPPPILGEGVAVHLAGPWHGKANRKWTKEYLASNRYVALDTILDSRQFRAADDMITYPESGAFIEFLELKFHWPRIRSLYGAVKVDGTAADFEKAFREACGEDFVTTEARFKSWARSLAD